MNKPIYCVLNNDKKEGTIIAIGITRELLMAQSVIKEHSRMNYKELNFKWEVPVIYVSEDGLVKYYIQMVSDLDKYKDYMGE